MFFKFARDTFGVYGGDEAAGKSAGHELRSLNALVGCNVTGLAVPLMATIDYLYGSGAGAGSRLWRTHVCVCACVCVRVRLPCRLVSTKKTNHILHAADRSAEEPDQVI